MRALYLRQVNWPSGRFREEQAHQGFAENCGGSSDGIVERGVAIGHERSPWKTTHNDLRLTVDALSGGRYRRGNQSAFVNYIRGDCGKCPSWEPTVF